MMQEYKP
jgi:hypothetical protein